MNVFFLIMCMAFVGQVSLPLVFGEEYPYDPLKRRASYESDGQPPSSSRMEDTLKKLRENTEAAVVENKKLQEKNRRFQERSAELEKESRKVQADRDQWLRTRDAAFDQLKKEVSQTQLMQDEIDKLNTATAGADRQELSLKDKLITEDVEVDALHKRIDQIRQEIRALADKVQTTKNRQGGQYSQGYLQQAELLKSEMEKLDDINAKSDVAQSEGKRLFQGLKDQQARDRSLHDAQSSLNNEIISLKEQQEEFLASFSQIQKKRESDVSQLNNDVSILTVKRDELSAASKGAQLLQKELALSIPSETLQADVAALARERDLLSEQLELMTQQWDLAADNTEAVAARKGDLKRVEDKVTGLKKEEMDLLSVVEEKRRRVHQTESTLAGLQGFMPRLKKALEVVREANAQWLRVEEGKLNKNYAAGAKVVALQKSKNAAMKDQLTVLKNALDQAIFDGKRISEQQQAQAVHVDYDLEKLTAEFRNLVLNKEYLVSTLKAVRSKLKDSNVPVLPWSTNEEKDLKNHVTSLKQENKHLQVELLSVSMEQSKTDGGHQAEMESEKNL